MYNPSIKICGVRTPEIAEKAAQAGSAFIGIVFHPQSKRFVSIEQAKEISESTKKNGATPVAVFVEQSAQQMNAICISTDIQVIQLQGHTSRKLHQFLPYHYQRFYVQSVLPNGTLFHPEQAGLVYCNTAQDYLLFDNQQAGSGQPFNWDRFYNHTDFRVGLAGGLTPDNVGIAIKKIQPALVDTSSGVENTSGEKDITLIKRFIDAVQISVRGINHDHSFLL